MHFHTRLSCCLFYVYLILPRCFLWMNLVLVKLHAGHAVPSLSDYDV